jgi:hypothetical protein
MTLRSVIVLVLIAGSGFRAALAQPVRDVLVVNRQHYVRAQQVPHNFSRPVAAASGELAVFPGGCAFAACAGGDDAYTFLRQFDRWANALHDDVDVDPALSSHGDDCRIACYDSQTWVLWHGWDTDGPVGRIFDHFGEPMGATFPLVEPPADSYYTGAFAVTEQGAAATIREAVGRWDLHFRRFSPAGEPFSDLLPFATSPDLTELSSGVAPLPDGGQAIGYVTLRRFPPPDVWHGYLRRVDPDQTMDPPLLVSDEQVGSVTARLLSDGTLLAGEIGSGSNTNIWLRAYDTNWQPLGERFEPMDVPETECHRYEALAYGEDGTIWVVWYDCSAGLTNDQLTTLTPFEPGDMNYDRRVDNFDITPFVMALADPAEYQAHYPGLPYEFLGDVNEDGAFDNFDITPFVHLLTGR